nr:MAG TPA: NICE-3 protein [Caudoviricetes sp.]
MAEEIIKVIEYITGNEIVQGLAIAYVVFGALVFLGVVAIFIFVIRQIVKTNRKWRR